MTPLGKRLKELREKRKLSVREFARQIDKTAGYVSRIEARGEIPSPDLLCSIADFHGIDPTELLDLLRKVQLKSTAEEIKAKHASALALYRKGKQ
jgi:transcriptional regulator with XRE-family HTH domain